MDNLNNTNNMQMNVSAAPPPSVMQTPRAPKTSWLKFLVSGLVILVIVALGLTGFIIYSQSSVTVQDQALKEQTVTIKNLILRKQGFLVIQKANRYGKPAAPIGATEYLIPDIYTDFTVDLWQTVNVGPGTVLFATVFEDNDGSKAFSEPGDKPTRDLLGQPVSREFGLK